jgi:hypothetical protein
MKEKNKQTSKVENETITSNRKELILPTDVSVGIKTLTNYEYGTVKIVKDRVETISGDEYRFFEYGVERNMDKIHISPELTIEKFWTGIKTIPVSDDTNFYFRFDGEGMSISIKSVMLMNSVDFWDVLWNGYMYYYYHTDFKIFFGLCNTIYVMIYKKGYNVNTITMDDVNNFKPLN